MSREQITEEIVMEMTPADAKKQMKHRERMVLNHERNKRQEEERMASVHSEMEILRNAFGVSFFSEDNS